MKRGMVRTSKAIFILTFFCFVCLTANSTEKKDILYINSYHIGFPWSDSINSGIMSTTKLYADYTLHTEIMHAKQFGQSKFDVFKKYLKEKYQDTKIHGIIASDNDALDFTIQFGDELFPDIPIVFCGIGNSNDYKLEGTRFYGITENNNPHLFLKEIIKSFPSIRRILIINDNTTTGTLYNTQFEREKNNYPNLKMTLIHEFDTDSLYNWIVNNKALWDAIFIHSIDQDKYGNPVDFPSYCPKLINASMLPVFTINQSLIGIGAVGGPVLMGIQHGKDAANLLFELLNDDKNIEHINPGKVKFLFDYNELKKFHFSLKKLPNGSTIINKPQIKNIKSILILLGTLILLLIVVLILSFNIHRRKNAEKKIKEQLDEIQSQHFQLEEAFQQLSRMMGNLEQMNDQLKESNRDILAAKKKAEESDTLKSAFLANVSHEIRTPLNAIVGFSSLLEEPNIEKAVKEEYINYIKSSTASLLVLINEILDLSRIEAEQLEIHKNWFILDDLLNEILKIFETERKKTNISINIRKPNENQILYIFSDRVRIQQIFTNLLTNAFKFTEEGEIEVGYYIEEIEGVVFYVKDTGIGIKPEFQPLIFDRFRKIEAHQNKLYRGTGLGLSITQKLTELLGGRIWVDSTYMKGSTFYFTQKEYKIKDRWETENT